MIAGIGGESEGGETAWYREAARPRKRQEAQEAGGVGILPFYRETQGFGFRRATKPCKIHGFGLSKPENIEKYMVLAFKRSQSHVKCMVLALSKPENTVNYMVLAFTKPQNL